MDMWREDCALKITYPKLYKICSDQNISEVEAQIQESPQRRGERRVGKDGGELEQVSLQG